MKNKIVISLFIFLTISLHYFPIFAFELDTLPVWSNTSELAIPVATEPSFDIASEAGILIEVTTRKSFIR